MIEHIIVFDNPPQYGKAIPTLYNVQIFDVPEGKTNTIIDLLENLGFTSIREVREFEKENPEKKPHILAEYFVGGTKSEYNNFWDKKEIIENKVDNYNFID